MSVLNPSEIQKLKDLIQSADEDKLKSIDEGAIYECLTGRRYSPIWNPLPGPQTIGYDCPADELFFGGAAGGGKSDLILGLALTAHHRSLVLRRVGVYLKGLVDRVQSIAGVWGKWRGSGHGGTMYGLPRDAAIEFSGCENELDKENYQGIQHDLICVAKGTKILMGDGITVKSVEYIIPGDEVHTLQGPKKVTRWIPKGRKQCYRIRVNGKDTFVTGDHKILTAKSSWASPLELISTQSHSLCNIASSSPRSYSTALQPFECSSLDRSPSDGSCPQHPLGMEQAGTSVYSKDGQIDCVKSGDSHQEDQQPPLWSGLLVLCVPDGHQLAQGIDSERRQHVLRSDPVWTSSQGCSHDYPVGFDSYDGPTHPNGEGDQERTPSLNDAEELDHILSDLGGPKRTQTHSLLYQYKYLHPYRKDAQVARVPVLYREAEIYLADVREVYDLTVFDACHYTSLSSGNDSTECIIHKNCFDEISHFTRSQYQFIIGWNRSVVPNQRSRVVCAGNPPTTPEGRWVIEEWAPWLDDAYPDPAKPGELRWYTTINGKLTWYKTGASFIHKGKLVKPRSRTFIPSLLSDNPILASTDYESLIQSLPEPLRSQLLFGDMRAGVEDNAWQVIPTEWVHLAQQRWREQGQPEGHPLSAIGVDIARGGGDKTCLSPRRGAWFAPLIKIPGKDTPDGATSAARVQAIYQDEATINIDVSGGFGGSPYDILAEVYGKKCVHGINFAEATDLKDKTGKLGFVNVRAAMYWLMKEALDPAGDEKLCLPPDQELTADLCAPRYKLLASGIKVEPKEDIIKRLGRSPDCGDAVVLAHWQGGKKKKFWMG